MPIKAYINNRFKPFFSASNGAALRKKIEGYILGNKTDKVKLTYYIPSKKKEVTKEIRLYKTYDIDDKVREMSKKDSKKLMSREIGERLYIDLGLATKREIKKLSNTFSGYKGIIFDLRNYPYNIGSSDITQYLYPN